MIDFSGKYPKYPTIRQWFNMSDADGSDHVKLQYLGIDCEFVAGAYIADDDTEGFYACIAAINPVTGASFIIWSAATSNNDVDMVKAQARERLASLRNTIKSMEYPGILNGHCGPQQVENE